VKKPQLITIGIAIFLLTGIYFFGRTIPKKTNTSAAVHDTTANDQHRITTDSILAVAKKQLSTEQVVMLNTLENSISRGDVKDQQIHIYHQLARFWADSAHIFEPYAWYMAQAARLENSEKSLTFAARLFLENLQGDEVEDRRKWKAMQAKDLFERSLNINPGNDSVKVGLGATYLFGGISATPMEGILKIREVAEKDSNNMYAQFMLGRASLISGQYDKAINRLETVYRHQPSNLDAVLLLAEVYERTGEKSNAIKWYRNSLKLVKQADAKTAIEQRINELSR
jgi:tetratricopeptide (TPR) repeat protein